MLAESEVGETELRELEAPTEWTKWLIAGSEERESEVDEAAQVSGPGHGKDSILS